MLFIQLTIDLVWLCGLIGALRPDCTLLIAVHSRKAYTDCTDILASAGFSTVPSGALRRSVEGTWRSDPDMLCVGPAHTPGALTQRLLRGFGFD